MANNYTPSYNQYLTQTAGYALPSSVRTYSVFDPSSNSWRRMTNDGRSPMQQGTQADIQAALRYADSSRGKIWDNPASAQPMVQTQTPGILLRSRTPAQAPAQTPLGGPRGASPASGGGTTVVPVGQGRNVAPKASQGQIQVPVYDERIARERAAFGDPMAGDEFLHEAPIGVPGYQGQKTPVVMQAQQSNVPAEVAQMFNKSGIPQYDINKADRPFLGHERDMLAQGFYRASNLANQAGQMYLGGEIAGPLINLGRGFLAGRAVQSAAPTANGSLAGFVDSLRAANTPATKALKVQEMRDIMNASRASKPIGVGRGASVSDIEAATNFSPAQSSWTPPQGTVINRVVGTPSGSTYVEKLALEAPVYPRYAYPPKPASIPNVISRADVNRASQAAENALKGRYSNVGGGLSAGKVVPRATVRSGTGDTSSIWANAGRGFQRYQTLQGNPRAFEPIPSTLQQVYNSRLGIPSIGFLVR